MTSPPASNGQRQKRAHQCRGHIDCVGGHIGWTRVRARASGLEQRRVARIVHDEVGDPLGQGRDREQRVAAESGGHDGRIRDVEAGVHGPALVAGRGVEDLASMVHHAPRGRRAHPAAAERVGRVVPGRREHRELPAEGLRVLVHEASDLGVARLAVIVGPAHGRVASFQADLALGPVVTHPEQGHRPVQVGQHQERHAAGQRARLRHVLDHHPAVERPARAAEVDRAFDVRPNRVRRRPVVDADADRVRLHLRVRVLIVDEPQIVAVAREPLARATVTRRFRPRPVSARGSRWCPSSRRRRRRGAAVTEPFSSRLGWAASGRRT